MPKQDDPLHAFLRPRTVRIDAPERATGFFIAPGCIITCAHVLATSGAKTADVRYQGEKGEKKMQAAVQRLVPHRPPTRGNIDHYPYPDLALLKVDFFDHPSVELELAVDKSVNALYAFGYPWEQGFPDRYPCGEGITFTHGGESFPEEDRYYLKITGGKAVGGLSGAPLINADTHAVCGVVKSSEAGPGGTIGRVIPAAAVISSMSDVVQLKRAPPRTQNVQGKQTAEAAVDVSSRLDPQGVPREWLNKQVRHFLERVAVRDPRAPRYLSLVAGPFFGKSWIAASLARTGGLGTSETVYHCFRRNEGELDDPAAAARAIAHRLRTLYQLEETLSSNTMGDLLRVLAEVSALLKEGQAQLIIIDGLDETFGPRGRHGAHSVMDILPEPSRLVALPGIAIFFTTRPELQVPWMRNPDFCKSIEIPPQEDLVAEVAGALHTINANQPRPASPALLANFAQASEGLLGLACEFFLRHPEKWDHWSAHPESIPHGAAHALGQLWEELVNQAKTRIDPRTGPSILRTILSVLAQTLEPVSKNQLDAIFSAADDAAAEIDHPRSVPKLEDIGHDQMIASLELAAELFEENALPIEERTFRFRHTTIRELLTRGVPDSRARHLPSDGECRYWAEVLAVVSRNAWAAPSPHQDLYGYALRHAPRHVVIAKHFDELFALAENPDFLEAQAKAFPDEPELPLQTLRLAIDHLQRRAPVDVPRLVGMVLEHALLTKQRVEEKPIQAFERHGLSRALKLISLIPAEETRVLLALSLAQRLIRSGNQEGAHRVLRTLDGSFCRLSGWQAEAASPILKELCREFRDVIPALAARILPAPDALMVALSEADAEHASRILMRALSPSRRLSDAGLVRVCAAFARALQFDESLAVVNNIADEKLKAEAIADIAPSFCHAGRTDDIFSLATSIKNEEARAEALACIAPEFGKVGLIDRIRAAADDILHERLRASTQAGLAVALAEAGSLDESLVLAKAITIGAWKADALAGIAPAFARAGAADEILDYVDKEVTQEADRDIALAGMVPAFACVGRFDDSIAIVKRARDGWPLIHALISSASLFAQAGRFDDFIGLVEGIRDEECQIMVLIGSAPVFARAGRLREILHFWIPLKQKDEYLAGIAPVYARAGRLEEIVSLAAGLFVERHRDQTLMLIAPIFARAGRVDESLALIREIVELANKLYALRDVSLALADTGELVASVRLTQVLDIVKSGGPVNLPSWSILFSTERDNLDQCKLDIVTQLVLALARSGRIEFVFSLVSELSPPSHSVSSLMGHVISELAQAGHLDESIRLARPTTNDKERIDILNRITPVLVRAGRIRELFKLARGFEKKACLIPLLGRLVPYLAKTGQGRRSLRLLRLASHSELNAMENCIRFSLPDHSVNRYIPSDWDDLAPERAYALVRMAPAFGRAGRINEIEKSAGDFTDTGLRARVFAAVACALAENRELDSSLKLAEAIMNELEQDAASKYYGGLAYRGYPYFLFGNEPEQSLLADIAPAFFRKGRLEEILKLAMKIGSQPDQHHVYSVIAPLFAQSGDEETSLSLVGEIARVSNDKDLIIKSLSGIAAVFAHTASDGLLRLAETVAKEWGSPEPLVAVAPVYARAERLDKLLENMDKYMGPEDALRHLVRIAPTFAQAGLLDELLKFARAISIDRAAMLTDMANKLAASGQTQAILYLLEQARYDLAACIPVITVLMKAFPESGRTIAEAVWHKIGNKSRSAGF